MMRVDKDKIAVECTHVEGGTDVLFRNAYKTLRAAMKDYEDSTFA